MSETRFSFSIELVAVDVVVTIFCLGRGLTKEEGLVVIAHLFWLLCVYGMPCIFYDYQLCSLTYVPVNGGGKSTKKAKKQKKKKSVTQTIN